MTDAADAQPVNLRIRAMLLVVTIVFTMMIVVGLVLAEAYRSADSVARARALEAAQSAMAAVDRDLRTSFTAMEVLALLPELQNGDMAAFTPHAERFLARARKGTTLAVIEPDGQLIFSTAAKPGAALPKRENPVTADAIFVQKKQRVSEVRLGTVVKRPLLSMDIPVFRGDAVVSDLAINPTREAFFGILQQLALPESWTVSLLDENANHVARLPALPGDSLVPAPDSLSVELKTGNNRVVETLSADGVLLLTAFSHSPDYGWTMAIGIPRAEIDAPVLHMAFLAAGLGLVVLFAGLFMALRLARPSQHEL